MDGFSRGQTEGGEALAVVDPVSEDPGRNPNGPSVPLASEERAWYALWTYSHCEQIVHDQLSARGLEAFVPTLEVWSRRGGMRHRIRVPMFSGYLFLRHAMDKASYVTVRQTRGLVSVLGESWDRLAVIPDHEVAAIQALSMSALPVHPHTFLREGQRVRISRGPLTDVEGILVRQKPNVGLLVVSVDLLQRSVAVEVDCTWVVSV